MAIQKDYDTLQKVLANYHKLLKVEIKSQEQVVEMVVAIYPTQEAKESGGTPLWHEYVKIPFDQLNFDPRDLFYPLLETWSQSYLYGGTSILPPGVTPHPPVLTVTEE